VNDLDTAADDDLLTLIRHGVGEGLELAGRSALASFRKPENVAGLAGSVLLPLIVFRHRRPPFIPWLIVALAGDQMFRMGYRAQRNLQAIADAAIPAPHPELVFHGLDCPGHTTGKPGESCLKAGA
jgi:hypothetical protein